jgi:hypothetical protein
LTASRTLVHVLEILDELSHPRAVQLRDKIVAL